MLKVNFDPIIALALWKVGESMEKRNRLTSWESNFETQEIPVRIHMRDGRFFEGEEIYVRQLTFDALGDYDLRAHARPNLGRAYFLSGAVIGRFQRTQKPEDEILKVEVIETSEDVLPRVRQSFGPGL